MTKTLRTYYKILDVSPNASDDDVRKAYLSLALKWHPDRNPGNRPAAQKKLQSINHAYAQIRTSGQRERYNAFLLGYIQQQKKALKTKAQKEQRQQKAANANHKTRAQKQKKPTRKIDPGASLKNTKIATIASEAVEMFWPFVTEREDKQHG